MVNARGIELRGPADSWEDGLHLGNGVLGAMLWGGGPLRVSLDRTDLWDLTPVPEYSSAEYSYREMRRWHEAGKVEDLLRVFEKPYERAAPTKIPAGRLELELPAVEAMHIELDGALAMLSLAGSGTVRAFVSRELEAGLLEVSGVPGFDESKIGLRAPEFGAAGSNGLARLGYGAPETSRGTGFQSFRQVGALGFRFAVYVGFSRRADTWLIAWSVASSLEPGGDPSELARSRVEQALRQGFSPALEKHRAVWRAYWERSDVSLPSAPELEKAWREEQYRFGSAARLGCPPISLQGPWTLDNGDLPPWKGDYHHDLNTELCYWPAYASNHLDEARGFVDWLWATREQCFAWTRRFFDMPGLNVPMTADLLNNQIGGWRQYTHSATTSAWLAHHFYLQWRYSGDEEFLRERAYPYLRDVATFLEAITTERDFRGKRTLPLSSSPEIHDNRPEAWFPTITNFDNTLIQWLFEACAELADWVSDTSLAQRCRALAQEMPELVHDGEHGLLVAAGEPLPSSHRHHSHLTSIHPFGLLDPTRSAPERALAQASMAHLEKLGTAGWNGYSFAWVACLWARLGDGARAVRSLQIFREAFCSRSGLHLCGDFKGLGYADWKERAFTLEGNLASAAAVQELLLQSHGGVVRVFPALPATIPNASFKLLAEGAFLVSAERVAGRTRSVEVHATRGGKFRMASPWGTDEVELVLARDQTVRFTPESV